MGRTQGDDEQARTDRELERIKLEQQSELQRLAMQGSALGVQAELAKADAAHAEALASKRILYGLVLVIVGLVVLAGLYLATLYFYTSNATDPEQIANNVVASMGVITGVIGSLVSAYFGIQLGSAGRERAEAQRDRQTAIAMETTPQNGQKL